MTKYSQIEKEKQEYEEYVESFAHEIKITDRRVIFDF